MPADDAAGRQTLNEKRQPHFTGSKQATKYDGS